MIHVTRLGGEPIILNASLIEVIEATPDTLITLATGRKLMVLESTDEVVERAIAYQQRIGHPTVLPPLLEEEDEEPFDA